MTCAGLVILANKIKPIHLPQRKNTPSKKLAEMDSHVSGSKKPNVISFMPRLEVKEEDWRVEPRENGRRAGPRVGARRAGPRDEARKARPSRAEPREAAKLLSSQTGINANSTGGARGSQTVPSSTPWRIFPSSKGGSSQ